MPIQTDAHREPDEILDEAGAADFLKVARITVRKWESSRGLPHYKPSRKCKRYKRSELLAWLERHRIQMTSYA